MTRDGFIGDYMLEEPYDPTVVDPCDVAKCRQPADCAACRCCNACCICCAETGCNAPTDCATCDLCPSHCVCGGEEDIAADAEVG